MGSCSAFLELRRCVRVWVAAAVVAGVRAGLGGTAVAARLLRG
jgi:hypothetical protein